MCVDAGFTSVMIDGSHHSLDENIEITRKAAEYAHSHGGITVEAELGRLGGIEDDIDVDERDARLTDPAEAVKFVSESGCDALAVAVGDRVAVGVSDGVSVAVAIGGSVGVEDVVGVSVAVGEAVADSVGVEVNVSVAVREGVTVSVGGMLVAVAVGGVVPGSATANTPKTAAVAAAEKPSVLDVRPIATAPTASISVEPPSRNAMAPQTSWRMPRSAT